MWKPEAARSPASAVARGVRAFGRFWWDFLVGDTPELSVAVVGLVGLVALLAKTVSPTAAWLTVPVGVVVTLVVSVLRAVRK